MRTGAAIAAYGGGELGSVAIPLAAVDRIIAIGSDGMMNASPRRAIRHSRGICGPGTGRLPRSIRRCNA
jgi:hypothetical protein